MPRSIPPVIAAQDLPRWLCHKVVRAAKIAEIVPHDSTQHFSDSTLVFAEPAASIDVHAIWIEMHKPAVGGYFVAYADSYTSYSPAEPFESGYTPLTT